MVDPAPPAGTPQRGPAVPHSGAQPGSTHQAAAPHRHHCLQVHDPHCCHAMVSSLQSQSFAPLPDWQLGVLILNLKGCKQERLVIRKVCMNAFYLQRGKGLSTMWTWYCTLMMRSRVTEHHHGREAWNGITILHDTFASHSCAYPTQHMFLLVWCIRLAGWLQHCDLSLSFRLSLGVKSKAIEAMAISQGA